MVEVTPLSERLVRMGGGVGGGGKLKNKCYSVDCQLRQASRLGIREGVLVPARRRGPCRDTDPLSAKGHPRPA